MADEASPSPTPEYPVIPKSYTALSPQQVQSLVNQHANAVKGQLGKWSRIINLPNEGNTNVYRDPSTGQEMYVLPKSQGGDRWQMQRGYLGKEPTPWDVPGAQNYRQMESELSKDGGVNPFTRLPWGVSKEGDPVKLPSTMNVGELTNYSQIKGQFDRLQPIDVSDFEKGAVVKQYADQARDLIKSMNPRDMGYLAQNWNTVKDMTDADLKGKGTSLPESRQKLLALSSSLENLAAEGAPVSGLPGKGQTGSGIPGAISNGLKNLDLLIEPGKGAGATMAAGAGLQAAAGLIDKIADGTFNINKVSASLGKFDNQLTQSMVRRANDLTSFGIRYQLPDSIIDRVNNEYIPELQKQHIGLNDNAWAKTPDLFQQTKEEQQQQKTTEVAAPNQLPKQTPQQSQEESEQNLGGLEKTGSDLEGTVSKIPAVQFYRQNIEPYLNALPPGWINTAGAAAGKGLAKAFSPPAAPLTPQQQNFQEQMAAGTFVPGKSQSGAAPASPKPSPTPTPTPTPVPSPSMGGSLMVRPTAQNTQDAAGVPRLTEQEHVDALEPGTPFYWADHPDPYVRV